MLDALVSVLASSGAGSIIGGVFGLLGRKEERRSREADHKFKLESIRLGGDIALETVDANSFLESQKTVSKFGDAIKSAVRPIITGVLLWTVYNITSNLETVTGGIESLPPELALELYKEIVLNVICLTATAVKV